MEKGAGMGGWGGGGGGLTDPEIWLLRTLQVASFSCFTERNCCSRRVYSWRTVWLSGDSQIGQLLTVVHHPQHVNVTYTCTYSYQKSTHPKACFREVMLELLYEADILLRSRRSLCKTFFERGNCTRAYHTTKPNSLRFRFISH